MLSSCVTTRIALGCVSHACEALVVHDRFFVSTAAQYCVLTGSIPSCQASRSVSSPAGVLEVGALAQGHCKNGALSERYFGLALHRQDAGLAKVDGDGRLR